MGAMPRTVRGMVERAGTRLASCLLVTLVAGACTFGGVSQDEFKEEANRRGGGVSQELALAAVGRVAEDQAVASPQFADITVHQGFVTMEVKVPDTGDVTDDYLYGSGIFSYSGLRGPDPNDAWTGSDPLESVLFSADEAGLDRIYDIVDDALEQAGGVDANFAEPWVSRISIRRLDPGNPPELRVSVETDRHEMTLIYSADGAFVEVQ